MTRRTIPLALGAALALAGCSSSSNNPTGGSTQHLYVGDDNAAGSLRVYNLPLSASSVPVATIAMNKPFTIGVNSSTVAVATLGDSLYFFSNPITTGAQPFAGIAAGSDGTPVFTPSGSLYQGGSGMINVYAPPFTSTSVAASHVTTVSLSPADLAIDPSGNIYETSGGNTIGVVTGGALATTLTAAVGTQFRGLAASSTQLFACGFIGSTDNVYIYTLPLTATAAPAVTLTIAGEAPEGCAVDANGNLYVGTSSGHVFVYAPPFTNASAPSLTLTTSAIVFGLAVGP